MPPRPGSVTPRASANGRGRVRADVAGAVARADDDGERPGREAAAVVVRAVPRRGAAPSLSSSGQPLARGAGRGRCATPRPRPAGPAPGSGSRRARRRGAAAARGPSPVLGADRRSTRARAAWCRAGSSRRSVTDAALALERRGARGSGRRARVSPSSVMPSHSTRCCRHARDSRSSAIVATTSPASSITAARTSSSFVSANEIAHAVEAAVLVGREDARAHRRAARRDGVALQPLGDEERRERRDDERGEDAGGERASQPDELRVRRRSTRGRSRGRACACARARSARRRGGRRRARAASPRWVMSTSAAMTRSCCSANDSPPGKRNSSPAARNAAHPSGSSRSTSSFRRSCQSPTSTSLRRSSGRGSRPSARADDLGGLARADERARVERGDRPLRRAACSASARACSRPRSLQRDVVLALEAPLAVLTPSRRGGRGGSRRRRPSCRCAARGASSRATRTSPGAMLPRLTSGPKRLRRWTCWSFCGASKTRRARVDRVGDLVDQALAQLAVEAGDAGRPRLARLADDLPGAGVELGLDLLDPAVRGHDRAWRPSSRPR